MVYHGTNRKFQAFELAKTGSNFSAGAGAFFFTPALEVAEQLADYVLENSEDESPGTREIMHVYLCFKNPLVRDLKGRSVNIRTEVVRAKAKGHDSLILLNAQDGMPAWPETQYLAFSPVQIKSATENCGAFDPTNPSILA